MKALDLAARLEELAAIHGDLDVEINGDWDDDRYDNVIDPHYRESDPSWYIPASIQLVRMVRA